MQPFDMDPDSDISVRKPTDMSTFRGPSPVSQGPSQAGSQRSSPLSHAAHGLSSTDQRREEPVESPREAHVMMELDPSTLPRDTLDSSASNTWRRPLRRSYVEINSPHVETEFTASGIVTIFTPPRTPSTGSTEGICDSYATLPTTRREPVRRANTDYSGSTEGLREAVLTYTREPRRLSSRNSSLEGLCDTRTSAHATYASVPRRISASAHSIQHPASPSTPESSEGSNRRTYINPALQQECVLALQQHQLRASQSLGEAPRDFHHIPPHDQREQRGQRAEYRSPTDYRSPSDPTGGPPGVHSIPTISQQVTLEDLPRASRPQSLPLPDGAAAAGGAAAGKSYCCEENEEDSGYSHSHGQNSDLQSFNHSQSQYSDLPTFTSQGQYSESRTFTQGHGDYSDIQTLDLELAAITAQEVADKWKPLFDKYDQSGDGVVSVQNFRQHILGNEELQETLGPHLTGLLETRCCLPNQSTVSYQHFVNVVSSKRRHSFKAAVNQRNETATRGRQGPVRRRSRRFCLFDIMVRRIAKEFLTDDRDRQYYADNYRCWPPPLFMPAITLIEIAFYVYYTLESGNFSINGPLPADSVFIYRPDRRLQIWRFLLYMLIHAGWVHLFFNMMVQLLVGVPLEMIHGSLRISIIYMAGVLAGSLGTSVFDMDAFLVGSSGGVYALLAAHLANILINYSEMELGLLKLAAVFIVASADVGFAIWDRYAKLKPNEPPVGYVSHLMGALAGLTIGLLVLKNFEQKLHSQIMWWVALAIYSVCMLFAILWNIFYY